jgi:hypothetical protein
VNSETDPAHEGQIVIGVIATHDAPEAIGIPTVRYVHYPGAQQLILWLPQSGYHGYGDVTLSRGAHVIEKQTVRDRLNGSTQILWNTLPWPPGDYLIAITHAEGWRHQVALTKLAEGIDPPAPEPPPAPPEPDVEPAPIIYRDGAGNLIPNADLELRGAAQRDIARRFGQRLEYEGNYRAGTIHYIDGDHRISFYHEMCGGSMKFSIDIPAAAHWEAATGTPLSNRDEILKFVAEQVKRDQAPNWRYEITPGAIDFY